MRVSVVIPCFNYGHLLAEALDSCLRQTHQPHQILVIDDGSTDDTGDVARSYGPVVTYVAKRHAGVSAARNMGARLATGDFVVFLDADDLLEPDYISCCLLAMSTAPPQIAYAYTPMRYFGSRSGVTRASPFSSRTLRYSNYVNVSALIRADVVRAVTFSEDLSGLEDFDFFLSLADRGWGGIRVNRPLLRYRKHDSSSDRMAQDWTAHFDTVIERHPAMFPRRVRFVLTLFRAVDRCPPLARATWRIRHVVREAAGHISQRTAWRWPWLRRTGA